MLRSRATAASATSDESAMNDSIRSSSGRRIWPLPLAIGRSSRGHVEVTVLSISAVASAPLSALPSDRRDRLASSQNDMDASAQPDLLGEGWPSLLYELRTQLPPFFISALTTMLAPDAFARRVTAKKLNEQKVTAKRRHEGERQSIGDFGKKKISPEKC